MTHFIPRFEFRIFGLNEINAIHNSLAENGISGKIRNIAEIYLMTAGNEIHNIKIRNKLLDIKTLVKQENGLEQWNPVEIGSFPLSKESIRNEVFPALGVESPALDRDKYTLKQFMKELILTDPDIIVALTEKKRYAYDFMDCICEYVEVSINGALQKSVAVESENPELVQDAIKALKIDKGFENVNYPKALKRVLGLEIDYNINKFF